MKYDVEIYYLKDRSDDKKVWKNWIDKNVKDGKNIIFKIKNWYSYYFGSVYKIFKRKLFYRYIYMYDKFKFILIYLDNIRLEGFCFDFFWFVFL